MPTGGCAYSGGGSFSAGWHGSGIITGCDFPLPCFLFEWKRSWANMFHDCPACRYEAESLGPVQGCEPPPVLRHRVERWSMSPAEWAGEPPLREPGDI